MNQESLVFIDAGYLRKLSKFFGDGKYLKIDIIKFAKYLSVKKGCLCKHIFYYDAPPFQSSAPTPDEAKLKAGYDSFIDKIKRNKEITVREGRLQKIGNTFTQKGVDTLLTIDLCLEPQRNNVSTVILLACDTDFVPVLNRLREENRIKVILYYFTDRQRNSMFSMSNHILTASDEKVMLTKEYFTMNLKDNTTMDKPALK